MELRLQAARAGRLSSFLLGELKMSTSLMNKLKWGEALKVNDRVCRTNHPVEPGDIITVALDEPEPEYPAQQGELTILYEDDWLLAVDKPAGMLIHPSRAKNTDTLANFVVGYYQQTSQHAAFHPLTRLDRDTFGVVLLAKNAHVHSLLQQSHPRKTYEALTWGTPAADMGVIDVPIGRLPPPSLLRRPDPQGKPARTEYRVLERGAVGRLELHPVTGRTHQLRVHCAWLGCPILGDPQYGSTESQAFSRELGLTYQQLWAKRLELPHPITGVSLMLESKMEPQMRIKG